MTIKHYNVNLNYPKIVHKLINDFLNFEKNLKKSEIRFQSPGPLATNIVYAADIIWFRKAASISVPQNQLKRVLVEE